MGCRERAIRCELREVRLCASVLIALLTSPAMAHRTTPPGSTAGLMIPGVSHGQMAVLAHYRAAIMDLAAAQYPTDERMRRIQSFVALQHFACAWGWLPRSISDETSPFNECSHAYLAGVRLLLLHLETMPGDRAAVRALRADLDLAMLKTHASLVLCRFSDEHFNTADVIIPSSSDILTNSASLAALGILALLAAIAGWSASWLKRALIDEPFVSAMSYTRRAEVTPRLSRRLRIGNAETE